MEQQREKRGPSEAEKNTRSLRKRVFFLMTVFGVLIFVPLVMKLYDIQINQHDELERKAIAQQTQRYNVTANRGSIFDRNMNVLASSGSAETVGIDPPNIADEEQAKLIARGLADILELDYKWILEKTTHKNTRNMTIAIKIDKEKSDAIREFIAENKLERMIKLEPDSKRFYTYSNMAAHVLGFVGRDNTGLDGLEAMYNEVLTGTPGHTIASVDTKGRIMPDQYEMFYDAQDGKGLILTIDETIQHILDRCIENAVAENEVGNRACGIVMDVKTGGILGMTTKGDFDPNEYLEIYDDTVQQYIDSLEGEEKQSELTKALQQQWRNKAVSDTYEPGSTFKIITTAIAVETGCIDMVNDRFQCNGIVKNVGGYDIKCHGYPKAHGSQTFEEALQHSCNPAFVAIAQKIGPERFYKYMQEFGFMEKTGVDLMGEASNKGLYHTWDVFSTTISTQATYAFGQTFKVTPIQMITGVSAVANGGYLMEPYVVSDVVDQNGVRQTVNTPTVVRQVVSQETSLTMRKMLEDAVALGTGRNAYVKGYRIAGKTGTSQKRDLYENGVYVGDGKYVVSFIGFAPADDPQIAVLVMLDEPGRARNLRSGGWMAAPVAGRIFADVLPYLGVAPHYTAEELSAVDNKIPDMKGKSLSEVKDELQEKHIAYRVIGSGEAVVDQLPPTGVMLPATSEMLIYTEGEAQDGEVTMPYVLDMTPEKVNKALKEAGLFMRATGALPHEGEVLKAAFQTVEAGKMIPFGTIVEIEFRNASVGDEGSVDKR